MILVPDRAHLGKLAGVSDAKNSVPVMKLLTPCQVVQVSNLSFMRGFFRRGIDQRARSDMPEA